MNLTIPGPAPVSIQLLAASRWQALLGLVLLLCAAGSVTAALPTAVNDTTDVLEDGVVFIPVLLNDADADNDLDTASLILVVPSVSGLAAISDPLTGTFSYTPAPDFNGIDSFSYRVCDTLGACDTAWVFIDVLPVNDPPTARNDTMMVLEGLADTLLVLNNDDDALDPLGGLDLSTLAFVTFPTSGSVSIVGGVGGIRYASIPGFTGIDSFRYRIADSGFPAPGGLYDTALVIVTVLPSSPEAVNDTLLAVEDAFVSLDVLANDSDPQNNLDSASLAIVTAPLLGLAVPDLVAFRIDYTPNPDANGLDSFEYRICDVGGLCSEAWVMLDIAPVNDPPSATMDLASVGAGLMTSIPVLDNDSDPLDPAGGLDTATLTLTTLPSSGMAVVSGALVEYTAALGVLGLDSFAYRIGDIGNPLPALFDTAWVRVSLFSASPSAEADTVTVNEDDVAAPLLVLANDTDPQDNLAPDSLTLVLAPVNGLASIDGTLDDIVYTPNPDFFGADSLTYRVCDSTGLCDTAFVLISVLPVNDPPLAVNDLGSVGAGLSITLAVLDNDSDPDGSLDTSSLSLLALPVVGTAVLDGMGNVDYTAPLGYVGTDSFSYRISDDGIPVLDDTAWVFVSVFLASPDAVADTILVVEDGSASLDVSINDTDPQGDLVPATATIQIPPSAGTASFTPGTALLTYTPPADVNGLDSLRYGISDATGLSDSAWVRLVITPVNDAPVAVNDSVTTNEDNAILVAVLANDNDASDPLGGLFTDSLAITVSPANGSAVVLPGGNIEYTPDPDFSGTDVLQYRICDSGNPLPALCATASLVVEVLPVNDPPVLVRDSASTNEEVSVVINVLLNDSDPEDGTLAGSTVGLSSPAVHGTTVINPTTGQVTYSPDLDYYGADSFVYRACDSEGLCDSVAVVLDVLPVNDAPLVQLDSASGTEDMALIIAVLANDNDDRDLAGMDPGSVALTALPAFGLASVNPDGTITYTPDPDFNGTDGLTYTACDTGVPGPALCGTANVVVIIGAVNDPPVVVADADTTSEDIAVVTNVLANDSDVEDGTLPPGGVSVFSLPANGSLSIAPLTGQITYTPDANFNGMDRYVYEACDGDGACDTASVHLVVNAVNDMPIANPDVASTPEDVAVSIHVLANDSDPLDPAGGLDTTSVTILAGPFFGGALVAPLSGVIGYSPNPDFNGLDSLRYRVCDTGFPLPSLCAEAWAVITVSGTNDPPVLVDDAASTDEDTPVSVDVLANDSDVEDGSPLPGTVVVTVAPANGSTMVNPVSGAITYTPAADFNGTDAFTYQACDGAGACETAEVTVTVNPVNDAPVANTDDRLGTEDIPLLINILANDSDPADPAGGLNPASVLTLSGPAHGVVVYSPVTGQASYTPDVDYNGVDSFRYRVCDLGFPLPEQCDDAVVNIALAAVNDAPLVQDDADATPENTPVSTLVTDNDSDPKDPLGNIDPASLSIVSPPANGTTMIGPGLGEITYTPDPGFLGLDSFVYRVCDNGNPLPAACATATVVITVSDEAPTAINDVASTLEDNAVDVSVLDNDTDPQPNLDTASVFVVLPPSNGVTSVDPMTGVITYTPDPDFNGTDAFGYRVCDDDGLCDQATVNVTIAPVNDAPSIQLDADNTPEDVAVVTLVTGNDSDPRDPLASIDPTTVSITVPPANGMTAVNPATGAVTYTPDPDFNGVDVYTYSVCDNGNPLPALCGTANVIITVAAVNDPPVVLNDTASALEDMALVLAPLDNDSDVEDGSPDPASVTLVDLPVHGTAVVNLPAGTITYTPNLNYNGPDSLEYRACDDDGACATAEVFLTVEPVNDPPIANDDVASTDEDNLVLIPVLANDNDAADPMGGLDPSAVSIISAPANGLASVDGSGAIVYTPNLDFNGSDALTYEVCDSGFPLPAACATAVVNLTINAVNDAPLVQDDAELTAEDTPVSIAVLGNDNDNRDPASSMDASSVVILVAPLNGNAVVTGATVTYTPDPGFASIDSFQYEACDMGNPLPALCGSAWVVVVVSNESPTAVDDVDNVDEDGVLLIDILANDTDPQNNIDPSTVVITASPLLGSAVPDAATGVVTYTPSANANGPDSFDYRVCDLTGYCDEARVRIQVNPVNDPPIALNDAESTPEDVLVNTSVLINDSDPNDPLGNLDLSSLAIVLAPSNGTASVVSSTGTIDYQPDPDFNGTDTYTYRICDDGNPLPALCDQAVVVVSVLAVDDNLVAVDDAYTTAIGIAADLPVLDNDIDPDGDIDPASVVVLDAPQNGTAVPIPSTGAITYTPDAAFFGLDTFSYRVCDDNGNCDDALVTLTVTASPPVAVDDSLTMLPNQSQVIDVLANDLSGSSALDPASVALVVLPPNGTAIPDASTGEIAYTPNPDFCGLDSFTYVVCDGDGLCDAAKVLIDVTCIDLVLEDDAFTTPFETSVTVSPLLNDGANADPACLVLLTQPENGTAEVGIDGTVLYTPDAGFAGQDCFEYAVCDTTESIQASAEICITVQAEIEIIVPVVFSPNQDGYNDRLVIPGIGDWPANELVVFNRWESRVFYAQGYANEWTGEWEGNGEPLPDGTYFFILRLDPNDPDAPVMSGSINIVR